MKGFIIILFLQMIKASYNHLIDRSIFNQTCTGSFINTNRALFIASYRYGCYPGRLSAADLDAKAKEWRLLYNESLGVIISLMATNCHNVNDWISNFLSSDTLISVYHDVDEKAYESFFETHPQYIFVDINGYLQYRSQNLNEFDMPTLLPVSSPTFPINPSPSSPSLPIPPLSVVELPSSPVESPTPLFPPVQPPPSPIYPPPSLPPLTPSKIDRLLFVNLIDMIDIPSSCDGAVDIAFDDESTVYLACQNSECVYKIDESRDICLQDRSFYHYNAHLAAIDIHDNMMVTCQNSSNDYAGTKSPNMFMGLTLYDLELDWIRTDGSQFDYTNSSHVPFLSHVDMLHEAPNCSGVVNINKNFENKLTTNRYFHTDNINAQVVVTDFKDPHGVGSMDHSSANVERLYGIPLSTKMKGVAADPTREVAYVADMGQDVIFEIFYKSGRPMRSARGDYPIYSSIDEKFVYSIREFTSWKIAAHIQSPIAVCLDKEFLYILGYGGQKITIVDTGTSSKIREFDTEFDASGMRIHNGNLYVVGSRQYRVYDLMLIAENCNENCIVKQLNQPCQTNHDCQSFNCSLYTCKPYEKIQYNSSNNLEAYLSSDVYNRSFVSQHILTGGFGTYANYLNLYPIMRPNFCHEVGNLSGIPDCNLIDFDSLLLGNCWGHPCLPNHLHCKNNGTLRYLSSMGYTCDCENQYYGDTCQLQKVITCEYMKNIYAENNCCSHYDCIISLNGQRLNHSMMLDMYRQKNCCQ